MTVTVRPASAPGTTFSVLNAHIRMPRVGRWVADVDVSHDEAFSGGITLELDGVSFVGTVVRSSAYGSRTQARIVGGAGGLSKTVPAFAFEVPTVKTLLADSVHGILTLVGEKLSSTAAASITSKQLPQWHRPQATGGEALAAILEHIGSLTEDPATMTPAWRTLADGTVWVGNDTYPTQEPEHVLIEETPDIITIAPDAPELRPGVTFRGQRIEEVIHRLSPSSLRTEAYLVSAGASLERLQANTRRQVKASRLYSGRVGSQHADGTVQIIPDDYAMASTSGNALARVPLLHGSPGHKLEVRTGARVRFGFANGDPAQPFAVGFEDPASTKTRIGQLLVSQNALSFALLPPQFFPAGTVGDLAAQAALAVVVAAGNTGFLVPIESGVWAEVT